MTVEATQRSFTREEILYNFWVLADKTIREHAEKEFIVTSSGRLTYQQVDHLANHVCSAQLALGYARQSGVGLFIKDALKIVPAMIGTLKAGHYFVPFDPGMPEATLKSILRSAQLSILITDDNYLDVARKLADSRMALIKYDEMDLDRQVPSPIVEYRPEDWVQILFTSGSTGEPKGAIEDYRYLANAAYLKGKTSGLHTNDRIMQIPNFTFSGPHTIIFGALFMGLTLCFYSVKEQGMGGLAAWLRNQKITYFGSTATIFRTWAGTLSSNDIFPDVRIAHIGSEKRTPEDVQRIRKHFPNVRYFRLGFASTETQAVTSDLIPLDYPFEDGFVPCGSPNENIKVFIQDPEGNNLPPGQDGEIVVYGDSLARGYINNPELTRERFIPDPLNPVFQYFKTGDLGRIREDGQLIHLGRIDNMVKIKGVRIELESLEKHMRSYPGLLQAAFQVFEDRRGNQKLTAYFTAETGIQIPISDLRKHMAGRLPSHLLPHFFMQLEEFPTTRTGKLDRNQLPRPAMTRPPLSNPYVAPASDLESTLKQIWEEEIGVEGIGVTDDFFEIGGDSLIGVVLFIHIEEKLGRNLPVSTLLTASTVRAQAEIISHQPSTMDFSPLLTIRRGEDKKPVFFIPGRGGYPTRIRHLARLLDPRTPVYALQDLMDEKGQGSLRSVEGTATLYLNEIHKVHKKGPCILIGESLGGKIALEMAQQMKGQGEPAPILIMLDTYNMGERSFRKATLSYFRMLFNKHMTILLRSNPQGRREYLQFYLETLKQKISSRINRLKNKNIHRVELAKSRIRQRETQSRRAAESYKPSAYDGKVILIKALRGPQSGNPTNGWDTVSLRELVIHPLDCYHGSILFEPAVSQLANILGTYIDNREGEQDS